MSYSRDANGTWRRIAKVVPLSDASGGPAIGSTGGYGDHDAVRDQDPANLRRPPMAPPANGSDLDDWPELMGDESDAFPPTIKSGPATIWRMTAKSADQALALYAFDRGGGQIRWMVKSVDGRKHQYADWTSVGRVADWRTPVGGRFQPGLRKSTGDIHPLRIDIHGRVATRLMADSSGGVYGLPDGNFYRLVFRGNDGSIRIRRDEIPLAGE